MELIDKQLNADLYWEHDRHTESMPNCSLCPQCFNCNDTGIVDVMGDGPNFEWDVVGHRICGCQASFDD